MISYSHEVFLGIPIDLYSTLLAICVLALAGIVALHVILYIFSANIRRKTHTISYQNLIKIIGILSLISTFGALIYQFGYQLAVCELCWWQRIFMFPIEFVVATTLIQKNKGNEWAILALSAFGIFFAGYHYWLHFRSWVQQTDVVGLGFTDCSQGGILPSCTDPTGVVEFGFLTIPFMALIAFVAIFWLCILAIITNKKN